jgi:hypothetical protein
MTRENYRDMRVGRMVNVVIPSLGDGNYTVYLYGTVSKPHAPMCHVTSPTGIDARAKVSNRRLNRFKHPILARPANSGVYSVTCSVDYTDAIEGNPHIMKLGKSFNITFIKGILLSILFGREGREKGED